MSSRHWRRMWIVMMVLAALSQRGAGAQTFRQSPPPDPYLSRQHAEEVVNALAEVMTANYVDSLRGAEVGAKLRTALKRGDYRKFDHARPLVARLAQDVQSIIHDGHFNFLYFPPEAEGFNWVNQGAGKVDSVAMLNEDRARLRRLNFGVARAEVLEGNIGWLTISRFDAPPALFREPLAAAFRLLQDTDALIIDLRRNPGGLDQSVQLAFSYLTAEPPFLATTKVYRGGKPREESWTVEDPGGPRYLGRPVYVLTSGATASGAEMFSYQVKHRQKGTLVGARTVGGAHSFDTFQIGPVPAGRFMVLLPNALTVDALTGGDWEGVGVTPDVEVPPAEAPAAAIRLALEALAAKALTEEARAEYTNLRDKLVYTETHGAPDPREMEKYVGRYGIRRVYVEAGQLKYQRDSGPAVEMEPVADDTFELGIATSPRPRVRFEVEAGSVRAMVLSQFGGEERIEKER